MNIVIGNYTLKSDKLNIWLEETRTVQTGPNKNTTYVEVVCGYHSSVGNLLKSFFEKAVSGSDARDVTKVLQDIQVAERQVNQIIEAFVADQKAMQKGKK